MVNVMDEVTKKFSFTKTGACGYGTLKTNQTRLEMTQNTSHHPYIFGHFAVTYRNMFCVCLQLCAEVGCGRQSGGSGGCVVQVDVYGE